MIPLPSKTLRSRAADAPKHASTSTVVAGSTRSRVVIVAATTTMLLVLVAAAFWYWDLRYSLPTPRPQSLVQVPEGATLPVSNWLSSSGLRSDGRPVHLHFFNPACPCSRFNLDHLHSLVRRFGHEVQFVAVVESESVDPHQDPELAALLRDLRIPWVPDADGHIAAEAGVYSTPQAVVVDGASRLYYRGNYNVSRYCNDERTEFARLALERLLRSQGIRGGALANTPAYGCELPANVAARATHDRPMPASSREPLAESAP